MRIELIRKKRSDLAIIGELFFYNDKGNTAFHSYTIENPTIGHSSGMDYAIPYGIYTMDWRHSPKYSPKFNSNLPWIYNNIVNKERYILIHHGNYEKDTLGCILLGNTNPSDSMVGDSVNCVRRFLSIMEAYKYPVLKSTFEIKEDLIKDIRTSNKDELFEEE